MKARVLIVGLSLGLASCAHETPKTSPPTTVPPVIVFSPAPPAADCDKVKSLEKNKAAAWKAYAMRLERLLGITPDKSRPADETD